VTDETPAAHPNAAPAAPVPQPQPSPPPPQPAPWMQPLPPPPPRDAWRAPRRVEAVPGTSFAVVHLDVPPVMSGLAVGALVAGIGSILVSFIVGCFGLLGAQDGWGAWVAGAFALIAVLAGAAGVALGLLGMRQIRQDAPPPAIRFTGRGLAIAGIACGATGLGITVLAFVVALLLQLL
jgi:hypothetical protein